MEKSESWKTWLAVFVLLMFAGIASATVPLILDQFDSQEETAIEQPSHPLVTTIRVEELPFIGEVLVEIDFIAENIDGKPITALQATGIATGIVLVSVGATGLLITLITFFLSRLISNVYGDESYQAASAEMGQRQNATLKELQEGRAIQDPTAPEVTARRSVITFAFIFLLLVWISGLVFGISYFKGESAHIAGVEVDPVLVINVVLVLVTTIVMVLILRRKDPTDFVDSPEFDNQPVDWGIIWVIVSGFLVVGLGTGAAIALRAAG